MGLGKKQPSGRRDHVTNHMTHSSLSTLYSVETCRGEREHCSLITS